MAEFFDLLGPEQLELVAEGLFTITETGTFLKVSRATVYKLMDRGELPFVKVGRARRIPKRAVLQLAAEALEGGIPINGGGASSDA